MFIEDTFSVLISLKCVQGILNTQLVLTFEIKKKIIILDYDIQIARL